MQGTGFGFRGAQARHAGFGHTSSWRTRGRRPPAAAHAPAGSGSRGAALNFCCSRTQAMAARHGGLLLAGVAAGRQPPQRGLRQAAGGSRSVSLQQRTGRSLGVAPTGSRSRAWAPAGLYGWGVKATQQQPVDVAGSPAAGNPPARLPCCPSPPAQRAAGHASPCCRLRRACSSPACLLTRLLLSLPQPAARRPAGPPAASCGAPCAA